MIELSERDVDALREALDQAYRGFATYNQVIRDFGVTRPLERIREVEAGHISVLQWLHTRYGAPLPRNRWRRVGRFTDLAQACAAAIRTETERIKMCRRLIATTRDAEVLAELRNLERASRDGHLPALRAWAKQLGRHKVATTHAEPITIE